MLTDYLKTALLKARYEFMDAQEGYLGEIPGFEGVLAQGATLQECREELASTLEDWVAFRTGRNLPIPAFPGLLN